MTRPGHSLPRGCGEHSCWAVCQTHLMGLALCLNWCPLASFDILLVFLLRCSTWAYSTNECFCTLIASANWKEKLMLQLICRWECGRYFCLSLLLKAYHTPRMYSLNLNMIHGITAWRKKNNNAPNLSTCWTYTGYSVVLVYNVVQLHVEYPL